VEHSPPPFFKRGPAPIVRLAFFASLSVALLVLDARFHYAESLRAVLAVLAYPMQRIALAPVEFAERMGGFFSSQSGLREENANLRARLAEAELAARRLDASQAALASLRQLSLTAERQQRPSTPAEIVYAHRDPYTQRVWIDRGSQHGVTAGSPVVDDVGVVGQITRAHPLTAEVTLLTDRDLAIPVQVARTGLRAVAFGSGAGQLELRFLASNAEIEAGDRLVTSGIDGTYPAGLPVATVVKVERDAARSFARILCEPAAGVHRGRYVLVLAANSAGTARPDDSPTADTARTDKRRSRRTTDGASR
jgi:rod shape-determining protein MreC